MEVVLLIALGVVIGWVAPEPQFVKDAEHKVVSYVHGDDKAKEKIEVPTAKEQQMAPVTEESR